MLTEYRKHVESVPLKVSCQNPLKDQVAELVELLKQPPAGENPFTGFTNKPLSGVDEAAYVKAAFLTDVAKATLLALNFTC